MLQSVDIYSNDASVIDELQSPKNVNKMQKIFVELDAPHLFIMSYTEYQLMINSYESKEFWILSPIPLRAMNFLLTKKAICQMVI